ncbi:MAG TPA: ferredoxin [Jatrophihabitans sp.]|nr:ferredoxin [Jatrophihabitans sp.]
MTETKESEERVVGDLTIRIDRSRCVGFGHCIEESPESFALGDDDLVEFQDPDQARREALMTACEVCPVEALTVFDKAGNQLVP